MFLEGVSLEEVEDWIDILNGTGKYKDYSEDELKEKQDDNPIQKE